MTAGVEGSCEGGARWSVGGGRKGAVEGIGCASGGGDKTRGHDEGGRPGESRGARREEGRGGLVRDRRKASKRRASSPSAPEALRTYSVTTVVMLTTVMLLRTTTAGLDGGSGGSVGGGGVGGAVVAAAAAGTVVCAVVLDAPEALAHFGGDWPQQTTVQLDPPEAVSSASNVAELFDAEQLTVQEAADVPVQRRTKIPAQRTVMHSHGKACGPTGEGSVVFASKALVLAVVVEELSVSKMPLSFLALKTELGSSMHSLVRQHCRPHEFRDELSSQFSSHGEQKS